jgi:hypothetical protein
MNRPVIQAALCLILCPLLMAQQSATKPGRVRLPKDTAIHLKLDQEVSSATIYKGNNVRYIVADDVVLGGVLAIPTGTEATRKVTRAQPSRPDRPCSDENNGSFEIGDSVLFPSSRMQMKLTSESPHYRAQEAMSPLDKVLFVILFTPQFAAMIAFGAVGAPIELAVNLHDRLHSSPPAAPCPANTHEMEWKASEAKVETYYLVRNYTMHANLSPQTAQPEAIKEAQ